MQTSENICFTFFIPDIEKQMYENYLSWHSYSSQVVRAFDGLATSDITNGMRVGESEVFNSAQQSAEIRLFQRMAFGSQNYSTDFFSQSSLDS